MQKYFLLPAPRSWTCSYFHIIGPCTWVKFSRTHCKIAVWTFLFSVPHKMQWCYGKDCVFNTGTYGFKNHKDYSEFYPAAKGRMTSIHATLPGLKNLFAWHVVSISFVLESLRYTKNMIIFLLFSVTRFLAIKNETVNLLSIGKIPVLCLAFL